MSNKGEKQQEFPSINTQKEKPLKTESFICIVIASCQHVTQIRCFLVHIKTTVLSNQSELKLDVSSTEDSSFYS